MGEEPVLELMENICNEGEKQVLLNPKPRP